MRASIRLAGAAALASLAAVVVWEGAGRPAEAQGAPAAGAKAKADAALAKGFAWLVKQQHENGSFGRIPGMDPNAGEAGMSALALRAMAKAPADVRKGLEPNMEKAAAYVLSLQQADGSIQNPGAGLTTYRTSIAIMAFQAYDPAKYADAIAKGRAYLEKTQWSESNGIGTKQPYYGGWGYDEKTGTKPEADVSNASFALEALKETGLPADSPVWKRAVTFLQRCQNRSESNDLAPSGVKIGDDGGFMYDPGLDQGKSEPVKLPDGTMQIPSYASITYAGLMSLLYANVSKDDPRVKGAKAWLEKNYTLDENRGLGGRSNPQGSKQGLFYYYHTFAKALNAWGAD
jgi:squalene-hopene/tetraprenyl-beta-curcumene cyclase